MSNTKSQLVVLAAGKASYSFFPQKKTASNTMMPVNGKPIIWWINETLNKNQNSYSKRILVIDDKDESTQPYCSQLSSVWEVVRVLNSKSILDSLIAGLSKTNPQLSTSILLGDTLFGDSLNTSKDLVYVSSVKNPKRWCMAEMNSEQRVLKLTDKPKNWDGSKGNQALCGYYHFLNTNDLLDSVSWARAHNHREISAAIHRYAEKHSIHTHRAGEWYDFGNIDNLIQSKHRLLQSRSFNSVKVDNLSNTLTKSSVKKEKLKDELYWYENLPTELKTFSPRVVNAFEDQKQFHLTLEFYGYYTLSELYLFSDLDEVYWETILTRLLDTHRVFRSNKKQAQISSLQEIYLEKTHQRIQSLESEVWKQLLSSNQVFINGDALLTYESLSSWILEQIDKLLEIEEFTLIHGDWCFSNILFDLNGHVAKFIDPRGRFGRERLYGDPRYDMAKLRHSLSGNYDFIVNDLFTLEEIETGKFNFQVQENTARVELTNFFDDQLKKDGFDVKDIRFIEGLLFLTMIPLHSDVPKRQKAMYLTALSILNQSYLNAHSH